MFNMWPGPEANRKDFFAILVLSLLYKNQETQKSGTFPCFDHVMGSYETRILIHEYRMWIVSERKETVGYKKERTV